MPSVKLNKIALAHIRYRIINLIIALIRLIYLKFMRSSEPISPSNDDRFVCTAVSRMIWMFEFSTTF